VIQQRPGNRIEIPRQEAEGAYRRPVIRASQLKDVRMEFGRD
jgi:hypothetical protein